MMAGREALSPVSPSTANEMPAAGNRPVSPGPSLLKRPPQQGADAAGAGPLGGKPQRNMLATPAQRLRQGLHYVRAHSAGFIEAYNAQWPSLQQYMF